MQEFCSTRPALLADVALPAGESHSLTSWGPTDVSVAQGHRPALDHFGFSDMLQALLASIWFVETFFRSLLCLVSLTILGVFVRQTPGPQSPLGKLLRSPFWAVPVHCVRALAVAQPSRPVLSWQPPARRHANNKGGAKKYVVRTRPLAGLLCWLLGFSQLPFCVWAAPAWAADSARYPLHLASAEWMPSAHPTAPPDRSPESISESPELTMPTHVDIPAPGGRDPPFNPSDWLGVTVFSPHHQTVAFGLKHNKPTTFSAVCDAIRDTGRLQCGSHDILVPLTPQLHSGFLTVLALPSLLSRAPLPQVVVVLDLSRVGGNCYAMNLPECMHTRDFLESIRCQINLDIDGEPLDVWVGDSNIPASSYGHLSLHDGLLLTVARAGFPSIQPLPVDALFGPSAVWDRLDHMPRPASAHCLAVCDGANIDAVMPAFFPRFFKADIALQVSRLSPAQAKAVLFDIVPPLDVKGEPCSQAAVVVHHTQAPGQDGDDTTHVYFLDLRLLGLAPQVLTLPSGTYDLPAILAAAQVDFPTGLCGELLSNMLVEEVQVLRIGVVEDLAHAVFRRFDANATASQKVQPLQCSAPSSAPQHNQGMTHSAGSSLPPPEVWRQQFGLTDAAPTSHETLHLQDEADPDAEATPVGVIVFSPKFQAEVLSLALSVPCTEEEALHEIADARNSSCSLHFAHLLPVFPQPDPTFACVLALPVWSFDTGDCLVDTRTIDGRLFSFTFRGGMRRHWFLQHLGIPEVPGIQVLIAGAVIDAQGLYEVHLGDTVTILAPQTDFQPGPDFATMLAGPRHWAVPCPYFGDTTQPIFLFPL